jgi:hypothetical protein
MQRFFIIVSIALASAAFHYVSYGVAAEIQQSVAIPGTATVPPRGEVTFLGPVPVQPSLGRTSLRVVNESEHVAIVGHDGEALTIALPKGFAPRVTRTVEIIPASPAQLPCASADEQPNVLRCAVQLTNVGPVLVFSANRLAAPPAVSPVVEAALTMADPRPCIPEPLQHACDASRSALWFGQEQAWAARGVTDADARFNETVVFRVRAGDPAAIRNIARILGTPYLKVTRVRFAGADFAEVTNLGGGAQAMTGWTLRSPERGLVFRFPDGFVLQPGQSQVICGFCPPSCPMRADGPTDCPVPTAFQRGFGTTDVFPDGGGRVVLYYDALELLGDDTRYSADPTNQPPPPNLQLIPLTTDSTNQPTTSGWPAEWREG